MATSTSSRHLSSSSYGLRQCPTTLMLSSIHRGFTRTATSNTTGSAGAGVGLIVGSSTAICLLKSSQVLVN